MKRLAILLVVLLLVLATNAAMARGKYSLIWQSDWPIDPTSVAVEVVGGELLGSSVASDGKSGQIDVAAERACVTIRMNAQTMAGFPIATMTRSWLAECPRVYLPMVESHGQ